jgi:hypothetical protein
MKSCEEERSGCESGCEMIMFAGGFFCQPATQYTHPLCQLFHQRALTPSRDTHFLNNPSHSFCKLQIVLKSLIFQPFRECLVSKFIKCDNMRKKIKIFNMVVKTQNSVLIANPWEKAGKKFTRKKFYHNNKEIWPFFIFIVKKFSAL